MEFTLLKSFWILCNVFQLVEPQATPEITPQKIPDDLAEGQRLSVMCSVRSGTPPISFSWLRNGIAIGSLSGVKIVHFDDFQDQLQIESLSVEHVGNYTCNAKNLYGTDHMSVQVVMKFAPRWATTDHAKLVTGVAGETVLVDCRAIGHPLPTIRVLKGNRNLLSAGRYRLESGVLIISRVEATDKGEYTCSAENPMAKIQKTVSVILSGARTILSAERYQEDSNRFAVRKIKTNRKSECLYCSRRQNSMNSFYLS
ncbi:immunoglobulin superfamily member 10-like [Varroa jacobsoni]|uniref:immunoglobulin superfamily member 10-like n=1 Tax=Varroa jacobsoni TaxID=62625 RepID=UPI000BF88438|nr:immunoglobulin superfamily member 10-like [Varroa jacobsoni]